MVHQLPIHLRGALKTELGWYKSDKQVMLIYLCIETFEPDIWEAQIMVRYILIH
jgi:hypothetical protein